MKHKLLSIAIAFMLVIFNGACMKKTNSTNALNDIPQKQKMVVVVVDKQTKTPIKDAKVYIIGDNTIYTTDDMGKTPEIQVELNKDYFSRYADEIRNKMNCGFVNIIAVKTGYAKHIEFDYNIFPGDSPSVARIELSKNRKTTINCNLPDINYIENIVKTYEKFEGEGIKTENMVNFKVLVTDDSKKPISEAKIVIPEAKLTVITDKKGSAEFKIPFDNTNIINYPVIKDYGEVTIIAYKDDYAPRVVLRAQVNKDGKNNSITLKLSKSERQKFNYEIVQPKDAWIEKVLNSYN